MTPSQARDRLLAQHARLREMVAAAADSAVEVVAGKADSGAFLRQVEALLALLKEHNAAEEAILQPLLTKADVLGPLRANRMFEEHAGEHLAFQIALSGPAREIADGFADFAEELLAHMEAEERTFLSAGVLRDPPTERSA